MRERLREEIRFDADENGRKAEGADMDVGDDHVGENVTASNSPISIEHRSIHSSIASSASWQSRYLQRGVRI